MKTKEQLLAEQMLEEEYDPRGCKGLAIFIALAGLFLSVGIIYGIIEFIKLIK